MAGAGERFVKGIEGRSDREDGKNRPREFFWDSIVLFVVFAIIGLTAVDVISEFVRGSSVQCFADLDNRDTQAYVNTFCSSSSVSVSEYFPVFMIVHGILIGIPHYLWLNHYGGSFEFFFQLATAMVRLRDYKTGEYAENNYVIVEQLEAAFVTYKRNRIFRWYVAKLILQWLLTVAGFIVAIVYFTDFNANFLCPRTLNETFNNSMWPLPGQQANCVFSSLTLIELLRIVDLILLAVVVLGLTWSLIWCFSTHSSELGSRDVAVFAFQSGLAPKYHVPKLPNILHILDEFISIPWLFHGPKIRTDLDFMVMKLFRTDGGLGHVLREVQILKEINSLSKNERRIFHLHRREQNNPETKSGDLVDKEDSTADLKWTFEFIENGIYNSYIPWPKDHKLVVPDSIRGAVLGYASRSASNKGALYITFGSPSLGFAEALGRIFHKVGCFNFDPYYNNPDEPTRVHTDQDGIISVTCAEDILTGDKSTEETKKNSKELLAKSKHIWDDPRSSIPSSFILIAPMDKKTHKSTVNYFLAQLVPHIADDAKLLYIRPLKIAGKTVEDTFKPYTPPKEYFIESDAHQVEVKSCFRGVKDMHWYAHLPEIREAQQLNIEAFPYRDCFSRRGEASLSLEHAHDLKLLVGDAQGEFQFLLYKRAV